MNMAEWVSWFKTFTFKHPDYFGFVPLWALVLAGVSLAIFVKWLRWPHQARDSRFKIFGRDMPWIALVFLAGAVIVSLAGPQQAGFKVIQAGSAVDITFAVDRSASMTINDVNPSRHELMMREINSFVHSEAIHPKDRLTLFTFSEKANWKMPLSDDKNEFYDHLAEIDHPGDKIYYDTSQLNTFFGPVLTLIPEDLDKQDQFYQNGPFSRNTSWIANPRIVFIFSDGDGEDTSLVTPLSVLAKKGIKVYTIGIGTDKGGSVKIQTPIVTEQKKLETITIRSKLATKTLNLIKDKTGGQSYFINSSTSQVQSFLTSAVEANRGSAANLAVPGKPQNFWWYLLAPVSLIAILILIFKF